MWRYPLAAGLIAAGLVLLALGLTTPWPGRAPASAAPPPRRVVVRVDGEVVAVVALTGPRPADALTRARVPWFPGDEVRLNGLPWTPDQPWPEPAPEVALLDIRRARAWAWRTPDGRAGVVTSAANDVRIALAQAGLDLHPADQWQATDQGWVWQPAQALNLLVGATTRQVRVAAETTGQALWRGGIRLVGFDTVEPDETAPPSEDVPLQVHRVRETWLARTESIPYGSETRPLPDVELDTIQVVQEGQPGIKVRWERVRYVDGDEAERRTVGEWVVQPPQPRVVGYGTKIVIRTLDTPEGPVKYWRAVRVYATSYSPCRVGGGRCSSTTASGAPLKKGVVAVTVPWYRAMKGMSVYVPGYGFGRILDTGGGIPGRYWIDLGYSDDDYVSWHQWTTIYFLAPPPPPENILYILP